MAVRREQDRRGGRCRTISRKALLAFTVLRTTYVRNVPRRCDGRSEGRRGRRRPGTAGLYGSTGRCSHPCLQSSERRLFDTGQCKSQCAHCTRAREIQIPDEEPSDHSITTGLGWRWRNRKRARNAYGSTVVTLPVHCHLQHLRPP